MEDLIESLQIFLKYSKEKYPTHCEHDMMIMYAVSPDKVAYEDKERLSELGWDISSPYGERVFVSYRFGSC